MRIKPSLLLISLITFHSCIGWLDQGSTLIYLVNNSGTTVAAYVADEFNSGFSYPETELPLTLNSFCLTEGILDEGRIYGARTGLSDIFSFTKQNVLSIFVFNQEDIDELGWEKVLSDNRYMVRYDLKENDLFLYDGGHGDINYCIYYPPSLSMKGVQMFPPYESFVENN